MVLQGDKKKGNAEWLNMAVGKVWNLYCLSLEMAKNETMQPDIEVTFLWSYSSDNMLLSTLKILQINEKAHLQKII